MRRTFALILSVVLLAAMFTGCGEKARLTGTWQATANLAEVMQSILRDRLPDSVLEVTDFPVTVELTFRRDGSCTFSLQEGSVQQSLEKLLEELEKDFINSLDTQMALPGSELSLEDFLKFTGVDPESLLAGLRKTFMDSDFAGALLGRMTFNGHYKLSGEKLYIAETEQIDKNSFAFIYKIQDGVLTLPMIAGVTPMELALTATICPLSFHKVS